MKWDSLHVTNVLLLIIAVLMLVMVAGQPRNQAPRMQEAPPLSNMGTAPQPGENPHMPQPRAQQAPTSSPDGFNFQNMVFAALECPSDPTITLADFGCDDDTANERREFVEALNDQGLPPRALFDEIIAQFGEEALTDEAREIRRNNRSAQ